MFKRAYSLYLTLSLRLSTLKLPRYHPIGTCTVLPFGLNGASELGQLSLTMRPSCGTNGGSHPCLPKTRLSCPRRQWFPRKLTPPLPGHIDPIRHTFCTNPIHRTWTSAGKRSNPLDQQLMRVLRTNVLASMRTNIHTSSVFLAQRNLSLQSPETRSL